MADSMTDESMGVYDPEQDYDHQSGVITYSFIAYGNLAYHLLKEFRYSDNFDYSTCDRGDDRNLLELYWKIIDYTFIAVFSMIAVTQTASFFSLLLTQNILTWGLGWAVLTLALAIADGIFWYGRDQAHSDDNAACFSAFETANVKTTAIMASMTYNFWT